MGDQVETELTYLVPTGTKPVIRVADYGQPSRFEAEYETRQVVVGNARQLADAPILEKQGFQLAPYQEPQVDFRLDADIRQIYYPVIDQLIRSVTGADSVLIFDHTVRFEQPDGAMRQPVRHVHSDYTAQSAVWRLRDLLGVEAAHEKLAGRVMQLNAWKSINGPVESLPLAMMDASSLEAGDLVATDLVYPDRTGEIYEVAGHADQKLYFYPGMTPEEVLLFKGWDSDPEADVRFVPHSAFDLPPPEGAPPRPRQSIELRAFAFFDN